ncbi:MAG: hypothetical protein A3G80_02610 [Betaproteobacteria bacterium RIFCSPLOWO2_12_FULL_62_13b]|nr:MAG: hypothetical protein A3G80_02610 [Betaproteobacteria bacterium RIFCSPLOWO2_12_FULL_62_13b]
MDQRQQRREAIRAQCEARGITIAQQGACYLLRGPGVDLMTVDLADLSETDLLPYGSSGPRRRERP